MEEFEFIGFGGLKLFGRFQRAETPRAALLIIHGIGEHSNRYAGMAGFFAGRGISVMSWDLRGHGLSEGKRGQVLNWKEFREDTRLACSQISDRCPTEPLFILGHSLGGTIALEYVQTDVPGPRGVIISAPALGIPGVSPVLLKIAGFLSSVTPGLTVNTGLDSNDLSRDTEECRKYRNDALVHGKACMRLSTELESAQTRIFTGADKMTIPLLLSYGAADRIAPKDPIEKYFGLVGGPDKTLKIFEDAYHEIHNDIIREDVYLLYTDWILARI